ncbi:hypothetical protein ACFXDJ_06965 [Streptomyces sp. NPDC059443]|uniref:hypothetical protein n=1 Tax=unclassified Streptomyces TaxID=2593676 RepID=UPI00368D9FB6
MGEGGVATEDWLAPLQLAALTAVERVIVDKVLPPFAIGEAVDAVMERFGDRVSYERAGQEVSTALTGWLAMALMYNAPDAGIPFIESLRREILGMNTGPQGGAR